MQTEDGSRLWLRYAALPAPLADRYASTLRHVSLPAKSSTTLDLIREELSTALPSLLGRQVPINTDPPAKHSLLVTTDPQHVSEDLAAEGYSISSSTIDQQPVTVIAAGSDVALLYATFHFLRLVQTGHSISNLSVTERPALARRLLNHWDNLDGSIERGYAGQSLWQWKDLPDTLSPRYAQYARACASLGLNGTVLNNVNTNPLILTADYLGKVAAIANVFRPYGLRTHLSVNFASPRLIGGLGSNDPLDPNVADWWKRKADEIYGLIPDFGGFLVKANSEGQPGPQDYGRTHADGANVLADALAPHRGIVMYRAFVYNADVDPDRVKRAYAEFVPLDGKFRENVIVQVKNGPLDFMPREPFHPLFGAMKQTPVMAELQVTQEYLGHSKHLVYLATMWKEFLDSDTHRDGPGTTVAKVLQRPISGKSTKLTAICGVANTGSDINWTGHHFGQANWYAFGRLAWDPAAPAEHIAEDWIRMTFTHDEKALDTIKQMMMSSRETFVDYTMPLGLHHLIGGDHYAPMPENAEAPRDDWTATYYHRASKEAIGFDRTTSGSDAVSQYFSPVRDLFDDLKTCPQNLLLWFHRLPWTHKLSDGQTLWDTFVQQYHRGAKDAAGLERAWHTLKDHIDPRRHREVADRLRIQTTHAAQWRDHCLAYFQKFSGLPLPTP